MNQIQKSLRIFGLEPGSSKEMVQRRYKRLIMVWHPDRFPTADGKLDAEEELKKINNAKDVLFAHFDQGEHRPSGCGCQSESGSATSGAAKTEPSSGPAGGSESGTDAEAEARRRDQERRRRASEAREEHARKEKEAESNNGSSSTTAQSGLAEAQKQQTARKENAVRWKVAIAEVILFFGVIAFAGTGYSLKSWWHDVSWKWERDHPSQQDPAQTPAPYQPTTERDYSNNTASPPGYNTTPLLPNGVAKPFDNSKVPIPSYSPPSTNTAPDGFNWKASPYETPSSAGSGTQTTTTTGGESALDYWSKVKTIPSGQQPAPNGTTTTTGDNQFDVNKYLNH